MFFIRFPNCKYCYISFLFHDVILLAGSDWHCSTVGQHCCIHRCLLPHQPHRCSAPSASPWLGVLCHHPQLQPLETQQGKQREECMIEPCPQIIWLIIQAVKLNCAERFVQMFGLKAVLCLTPLSICTCMYRRWSIKCCACMLCSSECVWPVVCDCSCADKEIRIIGGTSIPQKTTWSNKAIEHKVIGRCIVHTHQTISVAMSQSGQQSQSNGAATGAPPAHTSKGIVKQVSMRSRCSL